MAVTRWHLLNNPVEFVTSQKKNDSTNIKTTQNFNGSTITGNQAKNIYETIINEPSVSVNNSNSVSQKNTKTRKRKKSRFEDQKKDVKPKIKPSTNFTTSALFKASESGDLRSVESCLNQGIDANSKDNYLWTPLMMAAMNGNVEVVKLLLIRGAEWENEFDGSGYDAYDLACMSGHSEVANLLIRKAAFLKAHALEGAREFAEKFAKREKVWCDVCETEYTLDRGHMTSVLHRFSHRQQSGEFPATSHFYIGPGNRGYELLRRKGWDGTSGLGPGSSGSKYPVKTTLRTNRNCLGSDTRGQSRVTHFASYDESAVCDRREDKRTKKIDEAERKKKEKHLRDLEINFRREFQ